jgi:hypothetical protein
MDEIDAALDFRNVGFAILNLGIFINSYVAGLDCCKLHQGEDEERSIYSHFFAKQHGWSCSPLFAPTFYLPLSSLNWQPGLLAFTRLTIWCVSASENPKTSALTCRTDEVRNCREQRLSHIAGVVQPYFGNYFVITCYVVSEHCLYEFPAFE